MVTIEKITGTSLYSIEFDLTLSVEEYEKLMEMKKISRLVCDKPLSLESILNICTMDGIYNTHKRYQKDLCNSFLGGIDNEPECR